MSTQSLEYYRSLIEASVYDEPDMQSLISRWFPKLSAGVRERFQALVGMRIERRVLQNSKSFLNTINKYSYLDLAPLNVVVPDGLVVDYLTLVKVLEQATEYAASVKEQSIDPFSDLLSNLINNKTVRYTRGSIDRTLLARDSKRESIEKSIHACFSVKGSVQLTYEKAIKRNSDWSEVFKSVESLQLFKDISVKEIEAKVSTCLTYLDTIIEMAKGDNFSGANPDLIKHLAKLTEIVAKDIGFITTAYYHNQTTFNALEINTKELIRKLN